MRVQRPLHAALFPAAAARLGCPRGPPGVLARRPRRCSGADARVRSSPCVSAAKRRAVLGTTTSRARRSASSVPRATAQTPGRTCSWTRWASSSPRTARWRRRATWRQTRGWCEGATRARSRATADAASDSRALTRCPRRLPAPQIARFVRYLAAIEYWQRPDLGHWEEWPAVLRTSSIGCCVAGLRAVAPLLDERARSELGVDALASRGAAALSSRLGEGDGGAWEAEDRHDDAALLTLLLPPLAQQLQLTDAQREAVATSALRLRRPHGAAGRSRACAPLRLGGRR